MRLRHRPVVTLPVVQVMDIHFIPESGAKPLQSIIACNDSRFAICSELDSKFALRLPSVGSFGRLLFLYLYYTITAIFRP